MWKPSYTLDFLIANNLHYIAARTVKINLFTSESDLQQFRFYMLQNKTSNMAAGSHFEFLNSQLFQFIFS